MQKLFTIFLLILLIQACTATRPATGDPELERLASFMTGSFNSAAQAARDSNYFDITLHMYPIWEDRDGHWLYVEQAVTTMQDKPYRQRVYELVKKDGDVFESRVYTLKQPDRFTGAWKKKGGFDKLADGDIELKTGCEVVLKKQPDGSYKGATGVQTCPSELRGASYATSQVTIYKDRIVSWDQGFDDEGIQVWGAFKGGYEFVKQHRKRR